MKLGGHKDHDFNEAPDYELAGHWGFNAGYAHKA